MIKKNRLFSGSNVVTIGTHPPFPLSPFDANTDGGELNNFNLKDFAPTILRDSMVSRFTVINHFSYRAKAPRGPANSLYLVVSKEKEKKTCYSSH